MRLTGRAGVLAAAAVPLVLLAPAGGRTVAAAALLLAAAVVVDLVRAAGLRDVQVSRGGQRAVRAGSVALVTVQVHNAGPRTLHATLRDAWPPSAAAEPARATLHVRPGAAARHTTRLRPTRRGERTAAAVTVRSVGPLGLAARQRSYAAPWSVRVLPPFTSRRFLPEKLARLRLLDGVASVAGRGQGTEFDSLRAYVAGDDPRSVDWRATARAGDVVVRTWRPERDRRVLLVLDTGRTSAARLGPAPALDASIDAALLLAALARRAGDRVDLLAHDVRRRAGRTSASLSEVVDALTPLQPALVETDFTGLAGQVLSRWRRRTLVVLFTALDPAPLAQGLLPVLPGLVHRHLVVLAAPSDPRLAELAAARGDLAAAYGAAAAERTRAERRLLTHHLHRLGVQVVTALPGQFASVLADTYLDLKSSGRL